MTLSFKTIILWMTYVQVVLYYMCMTKTTPLHIFPVDIQSWKKTGDDRLRGEISHPTVFTSKSFLSLSLSLQMSCFSHGYFLFDISVYCYYYMLRIKGKQEKQLSRVIAIQTPPSRNITYIIYGAIVNSKRKHSFLVIMHVIYQFCPVVKQLISYI